MDETWLQLCRQTDSAELREKVAELIRQRSAMSAELAEALEFVAFVEDHVIDTSGHTPTLTLDQVLMWSREQRALYLAEAFLNTRSQ